MCNIWQLIKLGNPILMGFLLWFGKSVGNFSSSFNVSNGGDNNARDTSPQENYIF